MLVLPAGRGQGHTLFDNIGSTGRSRLGSSSLFDNYGSTDKSRLGSSYLFSRRSYQCRIMKARAQGNVIVRLG